VKLTPASLQSLLLPAHPLLPEDLHMQAAVLLLVCAKPEPFTILTLRSDSLPYHAGQISLPGGRIEAADATFEHAALREAQEETALDPASVTLLGRLPKVKVTSGFEITPVVGWIETLPQLLADPREVAQIITCPLHWLLQKQRYTRESLLRDGQTREFWVLQLEQHRVWGATASILYSLASLGELELN